MRKLTKILAIGFILGFCPLAKGQGTLPIYSDYLSDNIFMIHPSAAGIGNSTKMRLTHRQQWNSTANSPSLQTLGMHGSIGLNAALGGLVFNDNNGFHSQRGVQGAFAYHINFRSDEALDQLSFGLAASFVQNTIDQRTFTDFDPVVSQLIESDSYFNTDVSFAYHNLDGYAYLTVKNILLNARPVNNTEFKALNLRRYLFNIGYFFGRGKSFQFEPSVMFQFVESSKEKLVDINAKFYKTIGNSTRAWLALSYRSSIDSNDIQELSLLTPIAGVEFKRFLISYTYSHTILGTIRFFTKRIIRCGLTNILFTKAFLPGFKFYSKVVIGKWVETNNFLTLFNFIKHKLLIQRHLYTFIGDFIS